MPLVFLNSALLFAAAAAVVPLIIHFFHRKQAREDYLPTLRFLKEGFASSRRRFRLRNLLVLFLRILVILLLVATLARPAVMGTFFARKGTAAVTAVMVVDNSVSMAYERGGTKRLDRAKTAIKNAISTLPAGSRVGLVVTGLGPHGETLDRGFSFKADAVTDAVTGLDISAYGGDCIRALARAYAMIEENKGEEGAGLEIYVASDLAAHAWDAPEALKPPAGAATIVLDCDADTDENFHIEDVAAEWRSSPAPHVTFTTTVASGSLGADRLVEVSIAGAKRAEKLVKVPAGARQTESFDLATLEATGGPVQGRVTLDNDDPIRTDNTRHFTVPETKDLRCLVIRAAGAPAADGAFFIGNALEPRRLTGATGVTVAYADTSSTRPSIIDDADVVVLAGVPDVPDGLWKALEDAATAGKGLIIFAGAGATGKSYDAFTKAHFGVTVGPGQSAPSDRYRRLEVLSLDHPMLAAFAGGRNGNLAATRVFKWTKLSRAQDAPGAADQMMRVEGGDPAVLAGNIGKGRVVLAAFAPVPEETDLPLRAPFVPLVNEMVKYAAGDRAGSAPASSNFEVGGTISLAVERSNDPAEALVTTPLEAKPTKVAIAPATAAFVYRAFFPGNYRVRLPGKASAMEVGFSVNIPASESRLGRAAPEAISKAVPGSVIAKDVSEAHLKRVWGKTRGARELFDLFLVLVVLALAIEEIVANRIYGGAAGGEAQR